MVVATCSCLEPDSKAGRGRGRVLAQTMSHWFSFCCDLVWGWGWGWISWIVRGERFGDELGLLVCYGHLLPGGWLGYGGRRSMHMQKAYELLKYIFA